MNLPIRRALIAALLLACSPATPAAPPESFLEAPGPAGPLKGTLVSPGSKSAPVVLIIPGSGPTDRDGNSPLGIRASSYRLLAQGLAARGIATLRIDKRGMFASAAATPDANAVTIPDYVADVRAWVAVLRRETGAPCAWVLGHSEGGLVALASAKDVPGICGLVLIATPGRPLGQVLREQLQSNPANGPILGQALPAIDALEKGQRVDVSNFHPALQGLFNPAVQGFLISAFSYDPVRLLAEYGQPVLVLQGQRDLQVGEADARRLQQANPRVQLVLLPDVNHVLKSVGSDDVGANLATYADPGLPLAPGVADAVAGFLVSASKAAQR